MKSHRFERGQSIALIVLALAAMFAFAALAVDGGRVFSEHRRAQNAADTAAYAAGLAAVEGDNPYKAALDQAALNDFFDEDEGENPGQMVDVIINHPPTKGEYAGSSEYYEVIVRSLVHGTFSRIINLDELLIEAYAVVHAVSEDNFGGENAVHGLARDGFAVEFKGAIVVDVFGGNIMANGMIDKDGYSGDIHVKDGHVYYVKGSADDWLGDVEPWPEKVKKPVAFDGVPTPDCGTVKQTGYVMKDGWKIYSPGIYDKIIRINAGDQVRFKPGMFCLWGGIRDNGHATVVGTDVMFVLLGGDVLFNGRSTVQLIRPNDYKDPSDNQWGGMLVYVSPNNKDATVDITGANRSIYAGTIYAPSGQCRVGGGTDVIGIKANIVCNEVLFHGNPKVWIDYKGTQNWRPPSMLELSE